MLLIWSPHIRRVRFTSSDFSDSSNRGSYVFKNSYRVLTGFKPQRPYLDCQSGPFCAFDHVALILRVQASSPINRSGRTDCALFPRLYLARLGFQ